MHSSLAKLRGKLVMGAAAFLVMLASLKGEAPPSTQATSPEVTQLIKQLGSEQAADRDAAQKQLVEAGSTAIPALKKAADDSDDPEVRSRASAAISQLKDQDINGPSLITLHLTNAPGQDVLNAIGAQSHTQFTGFQPNPRHGAAGTLATINVDRKPFWEVLSDVCTQLNVCPLVDSPARNAMQLFPANRSWIAESPHQIVGPFWISIASVYRTRAIDLIGPQAIDDDFTVRLIVYPEPKLTITQMSEFNLEEAADDAGNSLVPSDRQKNSSHWMYRTRQVKRNFDAKLAYPQQPGKHIAILRGNFLALAAQDIQDVQFDDVLSKQVITNPLNHCKVLATISRQGADNFRVQIQCWRQGLSDENWYAMIHRTNNLTLQDASGLPLVQTNSSRNTAGSIDSNFTDIAEFSRVSPRNNKATKAGDPQRLTWKVATSLKPITVPVTFRNLPMP